MENKEVLVILEKIENLEKVIRDNTEKDDILVYDTKGLAKAMGMSLNYAGKLMATRGFPSVKVGGAWKVTKKALEEWLRHQEGHEVDL